MRFMVQLRGGSEPTYFSSVRDGQVFESLFPTCGAQMHFAAANEAAALLRSMGFEGAVVVDCYGALPSAEDLAIAKMASQERAQQESPSSTETPPKTESVLAQFSSGFVRYEDNRGEEILIPLPA